MKHPDSTDSTDVVRDVADRPDVITDPQAARAYSLLLVRTLFPAITPGDARRLATWVVKGKPE